VDVFNGSMLDVAIGLLLLFLVSSLIASAVVESVGGFLHRRQKHLWDTIDLLLGNTSVESDDDSRRIVNELYRQPFITGLVRPADRLKFDPRHPTANEVPRRAKARAVPGAQHPKTRASDHEQLARRYYGPQHIEPREFANALLAYLRPDGALDAARTALSTLERAAPPPNSSAIALASIQAAVDDLEQVATTIGSVPLQQAVGRIRATGDSIDVAHLKAALHDVRAAVTRLTTGQFDQSEVFAAIQVLPPDARTKLTAVLAGVADDAASVRKGVEEWFDRQMGAASAWYRKQTRWFLFIAGLGLAVTLNVDAVHAATTLYRDDQARAAVVGLAERASESGCLGDGSQPEGTQAQVDLDCVRNSVGGAISLPIGWTDVEAGDSVGWTLRILGWLFVAGAVTLGAPFWFDLLRRALVVRRSQSSGG
jgi:hypothetical protein